MAVSEHGPFDCPRVLGKQSEQPAIEAIVKPFHARYLLGDCKLFEQFKATSVITPRWNVADHQDKVSLLLRVCQHLLHVGELASRILLVVHLRLVAHVIKIGVQRQQNRVVSQTISVEPGREKCVICVRLNLL